MDDLGRIYVFLGIWLHLAAVVLCRGATSNDVPSDGEDYWPVPRAPHTANSAYIRKIPNPLKANPYDGQTGPYMNFYKHYGQFANVTGGNWSDFGSDTEVCANYQSFEGKYIGVYTCPMPHEPREYTSCCGVSHVEFCCLPQSYTDNLAYQQTVGGILFFGLIILIFFIGAILWNFAGAWSSIKAARKEKQEEKARLELNT